MIFAVAIDSNREFEVNGIRTHTHATDTQSSAFAWNLWHSQSVAELCSESISHKSTKGLPDCRIGWLVDMFNFKLIPSTFRMDSFAMQVKNIFKTIPSVVMRFGARYARRQPHHGNVYQLKRNNRLQNDHQCKFETTEQKLAGIISF